jgi:hypothetical protein
VMVTVAYMVHMSLVAIVLLAIGAEICRPIASGRFTCSPPESGFRTESHDARTCDAVALCSPMRATVAMPSAHRQRQPAARARSPCRASRPSRSVDVHQGPATSVCITSEGQLLIIRPSPNSTGRGTSPADAPIPEFFSLGFRKVGLACKGISNGTATLLPIGEFRSESDPRKKKSS